MRRILVGGIGRSGTTIVLNALYRHPAVHAVPVETKFLVEEDGFADLVAALTTQFSIAAASVAVDRFEHLMRRQVTGLEAGKFRQLHTLPSAIFERYDTALDDFVSLIHRRRYFPDPAPLLAGCRAFAAATFDSEAMKSGHAVWAEKTPSNVWRLGFLRALWPDCQFVHSLRDPRAILLSLMERGWVPTEALPAVTMFEGYVAALLEVRRRHAPDPDFVEIRLEDLRDRTETAMDALARRLRLPSFDAQAVSGLRETMDEYYRTKPEPPIRLGAHEIEMVNEMLMPAAVELGYPPQWTIQ